jgi:hypothetical protein
MSWESLDRHPPNALVFFSMEAARRAGVRVLQDVAKSDITELKRHPISPPPAMGTKRCHQTLFSDLSQCNFNLGSFGRCEEVLFEGRKSSLFVLANQLTDVFAGSAPVTRCDLSFYVFLQRFGERDVKRSHSHAFILCHFMKVLNLNARLPITKHCLPGNPISARTEYLHP